jgi:nucleoside-diphosphate-sugar epimerase
MSLTLNRNPYTLNREPYTMNRKPYTVALDPTQRQPDITLARKKMKWEPKIQLEEGLRKTIPYFEMLLSAGPR